MIRVSYKEKGALLHDAISAAGRVLVQIDGDWWADHPDVQGIIDRFTAEPIAAMLIDKVKALAGEKITAKYPQWKQVNMLARYAELAGKSERTGADLEEMALLEQAWAWIKAIRLASDIHEAVLLAHAQRNDFEALLGYDINAGWPDL